MKRIEYPDRGTTEFNNLTSEYKNLIPSAELSSMEARWLNWKQREGLTILLPETVEELLVADVDVVADVYDRFKSLRRRIPLKKKNPTTSEKERNPKLKELDKIFKYKNKYDDKIADFFVKHSAELHISSCYYCETAYINVYHTKKRQFDVDHFIPKEKCPILGLSLFNFVPSCQVCNSRIKLSKVLGKDKADFEAFNPAGEHYSFDSNVRIRLRKKPGYKHDLSNPDAYYIYFRCENGFRKDVRFFYLQERYEFHKLEAIRIKKLRQQYPLSARRKIARLLGVSESVVKEDLFNEQFMKDNNRCFTKLTLDMLK